MPSEYTHPFEAPLQPEGCDERELLAALVKLERELGKYPTDSFDSDEWGDEWQQDQGKVWLLLKCEQEMCKRRGLEFARTIHVPYFPSGSGVELRLTNGLRITYNASLHCPDPWPESRQLANLKPPIRAWIQFHGVLFFRVAARCLVSDSSVQRVNGAELWQNFGVIRAGGKAVESMFIERVGERWGRTMGGGFGFLFEIESSRTANGFQSSQAWNPRHWRLDLFDQVIEVIAGGVEIPDTVQACATVVKP